MILSLLMGMIKHSQIAQSNKFTISLQYLQISKKKLGMEVIFGMQINDKVSTSWYYPFWWKWPGMFKIPKIGSWKYFYNILRKIVATPLCSIVMQNIQIFHGGPVMFVVTCSLHWASERKCWEVDFSGNFVWLSAIAVTCRRVQFIWI